MGNAVVKDEICKHLIPELANIVYGYYYNNIDNRKQRIHSYFLKNKIAVNIEGSFTVGINYKNSYYIKYSSSKNSIKIEFYWHTVRLNSFTIYEVGDALQYKIDTKVYDNINDLLVDLKNNKFANMEEYMPFVEYILS